MRLYQPAASPGASRSLAAPTEPPNLVHRRVSGPMATREQLLQSPCRRRQRRTGAAALTINRQATNVSPFTLLNSQIDVPNNSSSAAPADADGRRTSASTLRRQHLENQLRTAREEMADIASTDAAVPPPLGPRRFLRLMSTRSTSQRESGGGQDLTSQLEAARARIHELEAHMNSEWALGLSDEPPPGHLLFHDSGVGTTIEQIQDRKLSFVSMEFIRSTTTGLRFVPRNPSSGFESESIL
ncbi:hypothetical protein C8R44DRAFT_726290 [Mycena epipterygia]|nr:hypothetical protein C8R44DRAFT_726290 [Mycena epipterygia]